MTGSSAATPLRGERLIRAAAAAAVVAVAGFAAVVSYSHIYDLGRAHGQSGVAARLPLSVDGLILAASLVLLHAARAALRAPLLARCMLWLGVGATVAANIAYGARYGPPVGAIVSAWPAIAFVGAAEMLMGMVRSGRPAAAPGPETAEDRAKVALQASIVAGNPLSARKLDSQFGIGRAKAAALKAELAGA